MAKKKPVKKQAQILRPRYILLFFLLMIFVLGGVYLSQQTQLQSISEEKTVLQAKLDGLKVEQERLERMLEYMQTDDYLKQYAREKLGYVYPSDLKFVDDGTTSAATLATPDPGVTYEPETTADLRPTVTPRPVITPTPAPTPTKKPYTPDPNAEIVTIG